MRAKGLLLGLVWILGVYAVQAQGKKGTSASLSAVKAALAQQAQHWQKKELGAYLSYYWNSDSLVWASRSGIRYGFTQTQAAWEKEYKSPQWMGAYSYEILTLRQLSDETVSATVRINRESLRGTSNQVVTQVWRKVGPRWVIILEHSS